MRPRTRTIYVFLLVLIIAALLGLATDVPRTTAAGADAVIDWWSASGGGGPGSSSNFTLQASIGQPDAGTGTGDSYTMVGGVLAGVDAAPRAAEPSQDHRAFMPVVIK